MTITKIDKNSATATATKAYIKKAHTFGTPEFYEWRNACKELGVEIELVTENKRKRTNENKNLTFENMLTYMGTLKNSGAYLEAFETVRERSKVQPNPIKYVLDWFKETFPNYKEVMKVIVDEKQAPEEKDNVVEMAAEKVSA